MQIARRGLQIGMPEKLLHGSNIHAVPDELRSEGVAQSVGRDALLVETRLLKDLPQHSPDDPARDRVASDATPEQVVALRLRSADEVLADHLSHGGRQRHHPLRGSLAAHQ